MNLLITPAVYALAYSRQVVMVLSALGVGLAFRPGPGAWLLFLATLVLATVAAVRAWITPFLGDSRSLEDVCSAGADRLADWAGWDDDQPESDAKEETK